MWSLNWRGTQLHWRFSEGVLCPSVVCVCVSELLHFAETQDCSSTLMWSHLIMHHHVLLFLVLIIHSPLLWFQSMSPLMPVIVRVVTVSSSFHCVLYPSASSAFLSHLTLFFSLSSSLLWINVYGRSNLIIQYKNKYIAEQCYSGLLKSSHRPPPSPEQHCSEAGWVMFHKPHRYNTKINQWALRQSP